MEQNSESIQLGNEGQPPPAYSMPSAQSSPYYSSKTPLTAIYPIQNAPPSPNHLPQIPMFQPQTSPIPMYMSNPNQQNPNYQIGETNVYANPSANMTEIENEPQLSIVQIPSHNAFVIDMSQNPNPGQPVEIRPADQNLHFGTVIAMSCFSIFCCFFPTGFVAFFYAIRGHSRARQHQVQLADQDRKNAVAWIKVTIIVGVLLILLRMYVS